MVELFLNNGADPEAVDSRCEFYRSTCELTRPGSKIYKILRDSVEKKVRESAEKYIPPKFWVWDAEKQMDVLVAYTFHAPEL